MGWPATSTSPSLRKYSEIIDLTRPSQKPKIIQDKIWVKNS